MFSIWQAHLSFILLGFVLLSHWRFTTRWRFWILQIIATLSFIPVDGLPIAAYVRSFTDDLAITTLVLLAWVSLCRLGVMQPLDSERTRNLLLLFGGLSVVLYPATLGLTYLDPYRCGFNPRPMIVLVLAVSLLMLWLRNYLAVFMLTAATLAFAKRIKPSENYWDYLIDPLLASYCLVAGLVMLAITIWRPLLKISRGQS
ncbi:hypothetical protein [Pseudomonas syringae group genomosp. 3]|uniref:hypothetical protein n=1 Tax=Pseudomonas syringae group genomosp. 3 TaxID=251701 RepID=UPI000EFEAAB3|nr:hypothetical protein [Pseudomonas syringae group genomosp. 3]RMU30513.1 hypothetical protein ALP30_03530 [Pseudomonas syringae pv. primulae]